MKTLITFFLVTLSLFGFAQEEPYISAIEDPNNFEEGLTNPDDVTILYMIGKHLKVLPDEIISFKNLEEIILDENPDLDLNQAFTILSQCEKLKSLSLVECNLNTIPVSIQLLSNLEELDLSDNNITYFPEPIKAMKSLRRLYFFDTKMSELHFSSKDLPNLEYINLCYNNFEIFPTDLGNLKKLKTIKIWANNMSVIPNSIEKLEHVEELNLEMNNLDSFPKEFSKLKSLKILSLKNNKLDEKSIDILYDIQSIEKLDIGENEIHSLSPKIKKLTQLKGFNISENLITEIPSEIKTLKKLEQLGLGGLPEMNWESTFSILSDIKSLRRIGMYSMQKTKMPNGFEKLQQVDTFWLTFNLFDKEEQKRIRQLVPNATVIFN